MGQEVDLSTEDTWLWRLAVPPVKYSGPLCLRSAPNDSSKSAPLSAYSTFWPRRRFVGGDEKDQRALTKFNSERLELEMAEPQLPVCCKMMRAVFEDEAH